MAREYARKAIQVAGFLMVMLSAHAWADPSDAAVRFIPQSPTAPVADRFIPSPSGISPAPVVAPAEIYNSNPPRVSPVEIVPHANYVAPPAYVDHTPAFAPPAEAVQPVQEITPDNRFLPQAPPAEKARIIYP